MPNSLGLVFQFDYLTLSVSELGFDFRSLIDWDKFSIFDLYEFDIFYFILILIFIIVY